MLKTAWPCAKSSPAWRTFCPALILAPAKLTSSPFCVACSRITTVSAPSGIGAPVIIFTASPRSTVFG
ncbi:Uncharacterised protein [Vibrio cholerae]|uniref:Uncharacterized protein n=1 Tax=Vibrio cholerae TaxID=666 RepID=A0A655QQ61_VIBCL|nr:Uncharacterised protein [Vibrio cholerae]CSB94701.1 Uncharacterised protein [Vibrio cholerae]